MTGPAFKPDPQLDLVLERVVDVPPEMVWEAWTDPEQLKQWFTPVPWKTVECEIDLRAGGRFYTVMESPEGERFSGDGCYLEVVPNRRLVFTDALLPGYRPAENPFMTAIVEITPEGSGTRYRAIAMHNSEATREKHEEMGFAEGWGKALDQMVAMIESRRG